MSYIRQKNTDFIVVNIQGYENNLSEHPAIVNYPDLFEIVEGDLPEKYSQLIFQEPEPSE